MKNSLQGILTQKLKNEIITFAQDLIRIKSFSGQEEEAIRCVEKKMTNLGYDEIQVDSMGNLIGTVGNGDTILMFDSHVDTVEVTDVGAWNVPPFDGYIKNDRLYGRGAVDMKSSVAASVYAAAIAKQLGLLENKKILVSCTVHEEYCDGVNLKHLFEEFQLKPDYMVICEPSNNRLALGHRGKAQVVIKTFGSSAHAAEPQFGKNAIYEMAKVIQRVEQLNEELASADHDAGSIIISDISSKSASLNAVPTECSIYIDRRLSIKESLAQIKKEMEALIAGLDASWSIGTLEKESWTGKHITYEPFHEPWKIKETHVLTKTAVKSYQECYNKPHEAFEFWNFSTNAVTPISIGIPCIGFGPGDYKLAHMPNENCHIEDILNACGFYTTLIKNI